VVFLLQKAQSAKTNKNKSEEFFVMNSVKIRFGYYVLLIVILCLSGIIASAQDKERSKDKSYKRNFCSESWSNGDKVSTRELREITLSGGSLTVDGKRNGGIHVRGENRSDILVRACVQAWGTTEEEANSLAKSIRIETGSVVRAESANEESNWGVSYEILVPRSTNLKLTTLNGGIHISDVEGTMEFDAKNGGIHLKNLAGDVRGKTTNGGVHIALAGNTWQGNGLNVETTNGGVHLSMPDNYAARFETRTVNGGFHSTLSGLAVERDENNRKRQGVNISKDLNGGGALVRVVTTNGGVHIN
jgi:hypothetical protein